MVLDLVPHWDYPPEPQWAGIDFALAAGLIFWIIKRTAVVWPVAVGAIAASLPDLENVLILFGVMQNPVFISHLPWFPHGELALPWGAVIQVAFIGLCFWLSLRLAACRYRFRDRYR